MSSTLKETFDRSGFVIVDNLIPEGQFTELRDASARVVAKTRSGQWPHRRVVGKQFPPFDSDNLDSWGVQHVMHPDLSEPAFAKWYTCDELVGVMRELLDCEEEDLQMELFNLLINPELHEFALRWHRDDVRENATNEEEIEALSFWHHGIQWNTALYKDSCLYIVPGSHNVPRTPEQRALSETLEAPKDPLDMPGVLQVTLKRKKTALTSLLVLFPPPSFNVSSIAGQTVFYNNNILHCATYSSRTQRATLHASIGDARGGSVRARNILQHGLRWMREARFQESLPTDRAQTMLRKLLEMEGSLGANGKVTQYSLSA
ncbi:hypothetical protein DFH11DRAFT_1861801 [Phellopilus nigrolimitatus]|nr:hypothetical protein DFH11DRAFT_1861801 [Phellopilus nigrolimitatus]